MPIDPGAELGELIRLLMKEGYPQKQAIAIAYRYKAESKRKSKAKQRRAKTAATSRSTTSEKKPPHPTYGRSTQRRGRPKGPAPSPYRSQWTAEEAQKRRRGGVTVNEFIAEPDPFCDAVDAEMCAICGEYYAAVRLIGRGVGNAAETVRRANASQGGGYRSRGPLLWAKHVEKQEAWYMRHYEHCIWAEETENLGLPMFPDPPSIVWAISFGTPKQEELASKWIDQRADLERAKFRDPDARPILPQEYTRSMKKTLNRLRQDLDLTDQGKRRKGLEFPTRIEAGKTWEELANRELDVPEELVPF